MLSVQRFTAPVIGRLDVGLRGTVDELFDLEWAAADMVAPVLDVDVFQLARKDAGVVSVANALIPFGIEFVELENDRVVFATRDAVDLIY